MQNTYDMTYKLLDFTSGDLVLTKMFYDLKNGSQSTRAHLKELKIQKKEETNGKITMDFYLHKQYSTKFHIVD